MNTPFHKLIRKHFTAIRKSGLFLSVILVIVSLTGLFSNGLQLGIDFSGGYITEISTSQPLQQEKMAERLSRYIDGTYQLNSGDSGHLWSVRQPPMKNVSNAAATNQSVFDNSFQKSIQSWPEKFKSDKWFAQNQIQIELLDSDFMGSQIGEELTEQGGLAILTAFVVIVLYLSARFEWRFALGAILALIHDLVIVLGIFAWTKMTFDLTVLAGLLAIVGYSLNDSIIIADRIREFLRMTDDHTVQQTTDMAIQNTLGRTLITSGTTLATIASVWWLGGASLQGFSVCLFWGIMAGTLSSLTIAATIPETLGLKREFYQYNKGDESLPMENFVES